MHGYRNFCREFLPRYDIFHDRTPIFKKRRNLLRNRLRYMVHCGLGIALIDRKFHRLTLDISRNRHCFTHFRVTRSTTSKFFHARFTRWIERNHRTEFVMWDFLSQPAINVKRFHDTTIHRQNGCCPGEP
jgi:hypothetical protein